MVVHGMLSYITVSSIVFCTICFSSVAWILYSRTLTRRHLHEFYCGAFTEFTELADEARAGRAPNRHQRSAITTSGGVVIAASVHEEALVIYVGNAGWRTGRLHRFLINMLRDNHFDVAIIGTKPRTLILDRWTGSGSLAIRTFDEVMRSRDNGEHRVLTMTPDVSKAY